MPIDDVPLSIKLPPELAKTLRQKAREEERTVSAFIRRTLRKEFQQPQTNNTEEPSK